MSFSLDFDETLALLDEIDAISTTQCDVIGPFQGTITMENDTDILLAAAPDNQHKLLPMHAQCESDEHIMKDTRQIQPTTRKRRINKSRERQKQELIELRQQVNDLEQEIKELNQQNDENKEKHVSSVSNNKVVWRNLANSQKKAFQQSQVENEKLRMVLHDQLKFAKSLERVLLKRARTDIVDLSDVPEIVKLHQLFHESSDFFNRERLYRAMDEKAINIDELVAKIELLVQPHETHRATADVMDNDGLYAELYERRPLPFSHSHVFKALWETFSAKSLKFSAGDYKTTEITHDTVIGETILNYSTPYHHYQGKETSVVRRYFSTIN